MVEGEYYDFLGIIYIDEDLRKLKDLYGTKDIFSAIMHETIHYIQNYSTLYGINKSLYDMNILLKHYELAREGKCKLILSDSEAFVEFSYRISIGETDQLKCHAIESIEKICRMKEYYDNSVYKVSSVIDTMVLHFHDNTKEYEFGGNAVSESVAYLFEKLLYNSSDYSGHDLPYNSCELVYEYIFKEKCKDYYTLTLAGYLSLMSQYPGVTFVELLEALYAENVFSVEAVIDKTRNSLRDISSKQIECINDRIDKIFPLEFDEVEKMEMNKPHMEKMIYANKGMRTNFWT